VSFFAFIIVSTSKTCSKLDVFEDRSVVKVEFNHTIDTILESQPELLYGVLSTGQLEQSEILNQLETLSVSEFMLNRIDFGSFSLIRLNNAEDCHPYLLFVAVVSIPFRFCFLCFTVIRQKRNASDPMSGRQSKLLRRIC